MNRFFTLVIKAFGYTSVPEINIPHLDQQPKPKPAEAKPRKTYTFQYKEKCKPKPQPKSRKASVW